MLRGWLALCDLQREVLPWHLWHRLSSSCSFISLSWLIMKALSHFLISVFYLVRQDLEIGFFFFFTLSQFAAARVEGDSSCFSKWRDTTSLQCGPFSSVSLTPSPFTVICSCLAWVVISHRGWSREHFFSLPNILGSFPKGMTHLWAIYPQHGAPGTGISLKCAWNTVV